MPRPKNKENLGLPARWRFTHGAYYYQVPPGLEAHWDNKKTFRLGNLLHEAYKVWAARLSGIAEAPVPRTISSLLDRYALEVIPEKAEASQVSNQNQLTKIRAVFGSMALDSITPQIIYQFVDRRSQKKKDPATGKVTGGRIAAHREVELLSHAFTKAVEWGYINRHPFKDQIRLKGEKPRDRYIEDWEIDEMLSLDSKRKAGSVLAVQAYIKLKLLTGLAKGDLLRLQISLHIQEDGIHNTRHKTQNSSGRSTIYEWTPSLREAYQQALQARPNKQSDYLFCNREGGSYIDTETGTPSGWKSMWQRFTARVLKETKVKESFTEHDIRAKVASDAESLEEAQKLMAHADSKTTKRVYRRKAERIKPTK